MGIFHSQFSILNFVRAKRAREWSGQEDLNLRPHGPEPCALTRLSYAPRVADSHRLPGRKGRILGEFRGSVNGGTEGFIPPAAGPITML